MALFNSIGLEQLLQFLFLFHFCVTAHGSYGAAPFLALVQVAVWIRTDLIARRRVWNSYITRLHDRCIIWILCILVLDRSEILVLLPVLAD
jgi:hypothetical protein